MPAPTLAPLRGALLLAALMTVGVAGAVPAAAAPAPAAVSFDDPGTLRAGTVALSGAVNGAAPTETTTVVYAVDVSASTSYPRYADCNGDGKALQVGSDREVGPDDLNGDHVRGDVLDCQLGAVDALNASLAAAAHSADSLRVGIEAFADTGAMTPLTAAGATLAAPGALGADGRTLLHGAAMGLRRGGTTRYASLPVGTHTNFDAAVATANAAFATAPAGPKWLMLLSDGKAKVSAATLAALTGSGVRVRTFAVGKDATCGATSALARIAAATGQGCTFTTSPANLASDIAGSQPDDVAGVVVSVGGRTARASVDPIGNWRARLALPKGTYTGTVTATLTSGATAVATRRVVVAAAAPTTRLRVVRPGPTLAALPATVHGTLVPVVGKTRYTGITVLLQGRRTARSPWVTVARTTTRKSGYTLRWKPSRGLTQLRVAYATQQGLTGAATAVPAPFVSACRSTGRASARVVTCRTAFGAKSKVTLRIGRTVVARTTVLHNKLSVKAPGTLTRYVLTVAQRNGKGAVSLRL